MGEENFSQEPTKYEPEGIELRQVQWAWLWSSMPWIAAVVGLLLTQIVPLDEITTSVVLVIIVVPRYFMWRRTKYTLTDDTLVYQRGGITSAKAYPLPISRIKDVRTRYGLFGRALGYQTVDVLMDNGAVASMSYLPIVSDVSSRIRALLDQQEPAPGQEDEDLQRPSEGPPLSQPPPSDTDETPDDLPRHF